MSRSSGFGQRLPRPRQILTMPLVGLAEKKQIVELPLFPPGLAATVFGQLAIAQALERFPLAPRSAVDCLLLVAQRFQAQDLPLDLAPLVVQGRVAEQGKTQFCGRRALRQLLGLASAHFCDPLVHVLEQVTCSGQVLVGCAQPQFLLMFHALPEVKHRFEGKTEGHKSQLGKASSRATVSAKVVASPGLCTRNRCSSGISASALSSVGSLPFWYAPMRMRSSEAV